VKINSFLASCILSLPLAVSLSGAAAAQATCPCFTAEVVNQTACEGSLFAMVGNGAEISLICRMDFLPNDVLRRLLDNDPDFRYLDAFSSQTDPEYLTTFTGSSAFFCGRPGERYTPITVQQWHSCNQILIDASK